MYYGIEQTRLRGLGGLGQFSRAYHYNGKIFLSEEAMLAYKATIEKKKGTVVVAAEKAAAEAEAKAKVKEAQARQAAAEAAYQEAVAKQAKEKAAKAKAETEELTALTERYEIGDTLAPAETIAATTEVATAGIGDLFKNPIVLAAIGLGLFLFLKD
jgi:hypothetical protein